MIKNLKKKIWKYIFILSRSNHRRLHDPCLRRIGRSIPEEKDLAHYRIRDGHAIVPSDLWRVWQIVAREHHASLRGQHRRISNWLGSCADIAFIHDPRVNEFVAGTGRLDRDKVIPKIFQYLSFFLPSDIYYNIYFIAPCKRISLKIQVFRPSRVGRCCIHRYVDSSAHGWGGNGAISWRGQL